MLKVAYSYGLRFNELRHLQRVDFAVNPHARQFGKFGVCKVRYGIPQGFSLQAAQRIDGVRVDAGGIGRLAGQRSRPG